MTTEPPTHDVLMKQYKEQLQSIQFWYNTCPDRTGLHQDDQKLLINLSTYFFLLLLETVEYEMNLDAEILQISAELFEMIFKLKDHTDESLELCICIIGVLFQLTPLPEISTDGIIVDKSDNNRIEGKTNNINNHNNLNNDNHHNPQNKIIFDQIYQFLISQINSHNSTTIIVRSLHYIIKRIPHNKDCFEAFRLERTEMADLFGTFNVLVKLYGPVLLEEVATTTSTSLSMFFSKKIDNKNNKKNNNEEFSQFDEKGKLIRNCDPFLQKISIFRYICEFLDIICCYFPYSNDYNYNFIRLFTLLDKIYNILLQCSKAKPQSRLVSECINQILITFSSFLKTTFFYFCPIVLGTIPSSLSTSSSYLMSSDYYYDSPLNINDYFNSSPQHSQNGFINQNFTQNNIYNNFYRNSSSPQISQQIPQQISQQNSQQNSQNNFFHSQPQSEKVNSYYNTPNTPSFMTHSTPKIATYPYSLDSSPSQHGNNFNDSLSQNSLLLTENNQNNQNNQQHAQNVTPLAIYTHIFSVLTNETFIPSLIDLIPLLNDKKTIQGVQGLNNVIEILLLILENCQSLENNEQNNQNNHEKLNKKNNLKIILSHLISDSSLQQFSNLFESIDQFKQPSHFSIHNNNNNNNNNKHNNFNHDFDLINEDNYPIDVSKIFSLFHFIFLNHNTINGYLKISNLFHKFNFYQHFYRFVMNFSILVQTPPRKQITSHDNNTPLNSSPTPTDTSISLLSPRQDSDIVSINSFYEKEHEKLNFDIFITKIGHSLALLITTISNIHHLVCPYPCQDHECEWFYRANNSPNMCTTHGCFSSDVSREFINLFFRQKYHFHFYATLLTSFIGARMTTGVVILLKGLTNVTGLLSYLLERPQEIPGGFSTNQIYSLYYDIYKTTLTSFCLYRTDPGHDVDMIDDGVYNGDKNNVQNNAKNLRLNTNSLNSLNSPCLSPMLSPKGNHSSSDIVPLTPIRPNSSSGETRPNNSTTLTQSLSNNIMNHNEYNNGQSGNNAAKNILSTQWFRSFDPNTDQDPTLYLTFCSFFLSFADFFQNLENTKNNNNNFNFNNNLPASSSATSSLDSYYLINSTTSSFYQSTSAHSAPVPAATPTKTNPILHSGQNSQQNSAKYNNNHQNTQHPDNNDSNDEIIVVGIAPLDTGVGILKQNEDENLIETPISYTYASETPTHPMTPFELTPSSNHNDNPVPKKPPTPPNPTKQTNNTIFDSTTKTQIDDINAPVYTIPSSTNYHPNMKVYFGVIPTRVRAEKITFILNWVQQISKNYKRIIKNNSKLVLEHPLFDHSDFVNLYNADLIRRNGGGNGIGGKRGGKFGKRINNNSKNQNNNQNDNQNDNFVTSFFGKEHSISQWWNSLTGNTQDYITIAAVVVPVVVSLGVLLFKKQTKNKEQIEKDEQFLQFEQSAQDHKKSSFDHNIVQDIHIELIPDDIQIEPLETDIIPVLTDFDDKVNTSDQLETLSPTPIQSHAEQYTNKYDNITETDSYSLQSDELALFDEPIIIVDQIIQNDSNRYQITSDDVSHRENVDSVNNNDIKPVDTTHFDNWSSNHNIDEQLLQHDKTLEEYLPVLDIVGHDGFEMGEELFEIVENMNTDDKFQHHSDSTDVSHQDDHYHHLPHSPNHHHHHHHHNDDRNGESEAYQELVQDSFDMDVINKVRGNNQVGEEYFYDHTTAVVYDNQPPGYENSSI